MDPEKDRLPDSRLPEYRRPEMPFEREASAGHGTGAWIGVGVEFAVYVVLFFLGGRFLDGRLGTGPWLTVTGSLVGVGVAMVVLIRRVTRASAAPPPKDR